MASSTLTTSSLGPMATNSTSYTSIDPTSASSSITGGYTGTKFGWKVLIVTTCSFAIYNSIELLILTFATFNKFRGIYFTSMLFACLGVLICSLGFLFKFYGIAQGAAAIGSVTVAILGWCIMVTGQSMVLWSRLHIVSSNRKLLKILLWMIIIDAIIFQIPTASLTWGANIKNPHQQDFVDGYVVMEKIQVTGFFVQEAVLSTVYIKETVRILHSSLRKNTRKIVYQLLLINVIILMLDLAIVIIEWANLYLLQVTLKILIYSLKLKLEFAVLGRIIQAVTTPFQMNEVQVTGEATTPRLSDTYEPSQGRQSLRGSRGTADTLVPCDTNDFLVGKKGMDEKTTKPDECQRRPSRFPELDLEIANVGAERSSSQ